MGNKWHEPADRLFVRIPAEMVQWLRKTAPTAGVSLNEFTYYLLKAARENYEQQS